MARERRFKTTIAIRVTDEVTARLDAIAERFAGVANRGIVARRAIELGLDVLEADPARLFDAPTPSRPDRKARRPK